MNNATASTTSPQVSKLTPLDEASFKPIHLLATVCVLGGAFVDGYILGIIGPGLVLGQPELQLGPLAQGLIASSALIGVFIGGLIFGSLADRFGRRPVFFWNLLAFVALSLLQLVTVGVWDLVLIRLALGLAIGVEYAVGTAVLAEFSQRKGRGVILGNFAVFWMIGFVCAFLVGVVWTGDSWRLLLATSAVPAFIVFVLRTRLPETPMWLKAKGRVEESEAVVRKHYGEGYYIPEVVLDERQPSLREIFTRDTWRSSVYSGLFWFCQVGPFFAIFTFLTPVFDSLGIEQTTGTEVVLNLIQLAGAGFGLLLLHWLSRRGFVILTFAIIALTLIALGVLPGTSQWVIFLFGLYLFMAPAANNIQYVYPSEIFDTRVRGTGIGFSAAFSRVSAAAVTYMLPWLMAQFGGSVTMLIMAIFPIIGLVASIAWAPETKETSLT
ncbi:MFS transporter [Enteractinococcus coprophilus]|uniref:Putative MFS transporter n=1 Tax=Enteractinococcus coprophilus TaxID=1027633 RepID=A0A543AIU4_9MICC|nr:MFS transporter [Enteractinococcus coprophilus]TQL72483.1 putative MFS transporter [Enteractinococcus coprophilus]